MRNQSLGETAAKLGCGAFKSKFCWEKLLAMGSHGELPCHAGTVMAGVEASWRENKHTDAQIRGANGAAVRCHRLVLAVSPLLGQLIDDDEEEVLVVLPGVGQQELNLLLLLLYTGEADTYDTRLQELLSRLQVNLLFRSQTFTCSIAGIPCKCKC